MHDSVQIIAALRHRLARMESRIEGVQQTQTAGVVALGHPAIDDRLAGGLERGRLHEIFAAVGDDASSAAGFAAMIVRRAARHGAATLWLRLEEAQSKGGRLHVPGLVELGIDPAALVVGVLPDPLSLLRVAAEAARCTDLGVVVIELWRAPRLLDLTASRRLAVAAESSGAIIVMLRVDAEPTPSAAQTRWAIRSAAAVPLAANAPGHPAFDVELLRQRGGRAGGRWLVEWDREQAIFRDQAAFAADGGPPVAIGPPLSGAVVSAVIGGPRDPAWRRAG